jgi:hypothetical protein
VGAIPEHAGVTALTTPQAFADTTLAYLTNDALWMTTHTALSPLPRPRWTQNTFFNGV